MSSYGHWSASACLAIWVVCSVVGDRANASETGDVKRRVSERVAINWTRMELEVLGSAVDPALALDTKPLEQRAISVIDKRVGADCALVPIRRDLTLGRVASRLADDALNSWRIAEGRYHEDGKVEVVGVVELQPLAADWMTGRAIPGPPLSGDQYSGVVIDARGTRVEPAYAPRVLDPAGEVLFDSVLWVDVAFERTPVVWVSDPAHPDAQRAGEKPAFFVATARGSDLRLNADDAARFLRDVASTRMIGEGAVVVVVDP